MGFLDRSRGVPKRDRSEPPVGLGSKVDAQAVLDQHFVRLDRLERAKKERLVDEAMAVSRSVVEDLGEVIEAWWASAAETWHPEPVPADYTWLPPSLPAVETICQLAPAIDDAEALQDLLQAISRHSVLQPHEVAVHAALEDLTTGRAVLDHLRSNPGAKQSGLAKQLDLDGQRVRKILHWMAELGVVSRKKVGSTYALSIPGGPSPEVPADRQPLIEKDSSQARSSSSGASSRSAPTSRAPGARVMPTPPPREVIDGCSSGDFVALDFETATADRASACALALVVVEGGVVTDERSWLIQPPENRYDAFNSMLHGIGPDDTADAPGFPEVMSEATSLIEDRPVLAHYAPFDLGVLRAGYVNAGQPWPAMTVGCTVILSRRCWPGLASYSLPLVADFLSLEPFVHHDATADARTCAAIARAVVVDTSSSQLTDAAHAVGVSFGRLDPGTYNPCLADTQSIRSSLVHPDSADLDPEHPFAHARVAFTGALMSMPRRDAAQLVVNAGGEFSTNVSKKTNYLVFGQQHFTRFVDGESSAKTKKALALIDEAHPLQIIGESEFLRML